MPLPSDEKVVETSKDIVEILHALAGPHPGYRPAHAKGVVLTGTFTPSASAAGLSSAKHLTDLSTPVTVRFSVSTGLPQIPDTDLNANPQGIAIRFNLGTDEQGKRVHTDIVAHSTPFFPTQTGEEFLGLFEAISKSGPDASKPTPIEQFLGSHPKALAFVQAPKPPPVSFATQAFYSIHAFKLINSNGNETFVRYQVVPSLGHQVLDEVSLKEKGPNYLSEDLRKRAEEGPIAFKLKTQIAEAGDITDNATEQWPDSRQIVELGEVVLDKILSEDESIKLQKTIIFDPIPRIKGVERSADPVLDIRAAVYLISGRERRAA